VSWDEFDASAYEDERTRDTEVAHAAVLRLLKRQKLSFDYAVGGAALRAHLGTYVVEARGQSSAAAHGKQGADPRRLAALRELDKPALLLFVESGAKTLEAIWLHTAPPAVNIDNDPSHRRQGWWVRDMDYHGPLDEWVFPRSVPELDLTASGRMF